MRADFVLFNDWKRQKHMEAHSKYLLNELLFQDLHSLKTQLFIDHNQGEPNMLRIYMILKSPTSNSLTAQGSGENLHALPVLIQMATGTPRKLSTLKARLPNGYFNENSRGWLVQTHNEVIFSCKNFLNKVF